MQRSALRMIAPAAGCNIRLQIRPPNTKLERETDCPRNWRNRNENVYSRIIRRALQRGSKRRG